MTYISAASSSVLTRQFVTLRPLCTEPYREGASHFKAAKGILHCKPTSIQPPKKFKAVFLHLAQGITLCIPLVNIIIYLALKRFGKHANAPTTHGSHYITNQLTPSKNNSINRFSRKIPHLLDLPKHILLHICSYTDVYDLGNLARVNRSIWDIANQDSLWRYWATKFQIPLQNDENPRHKLTQLLKFFKIDQTTQTLTILKRPKSQDQIDQYIQEALFPYPFAACLLIPRDAQHYHFYYKDFDHQIYSWRDIDINCPFSARLNTSERVLADQRFIKLKLA